MTVARTYRRAPAGTPASATRWPAVRLAVGGVFLLVMSLFARESRVHAQYELIASFRAEPTEIEPRTVRFEWTFEPEYQEDEFTCTLDVDGNRIGIVELSLADCGSETSVTWTYEEPGTYEAVLVATRRAGGSDRATTTVTVAGENAAAEFEIRNRPS